MQNRKAFEALLRVFETAYVTKVSDHIELAIQEEGKKAVYSRLHY